MASKKHKKLSSFPMNKVMTDTEILNSYGGANLTDLSYNYIDSQSSIAPERERPNQIQSISNN